ncbi:hypothetical protein DFQ29_003950 [Apophysomyces sp. BC1021]|nr:hypothetical protein DFQ29_003950 [Apophysomyces sp. BC1021]
MWTRWICCFLLFILIGLAIAAGVLASQFKQPQVSFNGVTNDPNGLPRFQKSDSNSLAFNINMGFQFSVENPNIEQLTFETIKAMAYYPTAPHQQIGGGELRDLHIDAYGTTNFTFPFHIQYDPAKDPQHAILMDIISKCGPSGGQDFVDAELPLPTDVALVNAQQQPE